MEACEEKSVVIMNTPDKNANAVEELVFAKVMISGFDAADKSTASSLHAGTEISPRT